MQNIRRLYRFSIQIIDLQEPFPYLPAGVNPVPESVDNLKQFEDYGLEKQNFHKYFENFIKTVNDPSFDSILQQCCIREIQLLIRSSLCNFEKKKQKIIIIHDNNVVDDIILDNVYVKHDPYNHDPVPHSIKFGKYKWNVVNWEPQTLQVSFFIRCKTLLKLPREQIHPNCYHRVSFQSVKSDPVTIDLKAPLQSLNASLLTPNHKWLIGQIDGCCLARVI